MYCENCGSQIPDSSSYCDQCGTPVKIVSQESPVGASKSPVLWILGGIAGCVIIVGFTLVVLYAAGALGNKKDAQQTSSQGRDGIQEQAATAEPTATPVEPIEPTPYSPTNDDIDNQWEPKENDNIYEAEMGAEETLKISMNCLESVTATSELSERGMTHSADRVCDGTLKRAWVEGTAGYGIGEGITFTFDDSYRISGLKINAGYQKSRSLYYKNARPKKLRLYFSDGSSRRITLQDTYGRQKITFDTPIIAGEVTVSIESVYKGSKYSDTVISELSWF